MRPISGLAFCLAVIVSAGATTAAAQAPEFRALWLTRFEWPRADPDACRAYIDNAMQAMASANFNAVFFQIRGQADVLYPSPYEVWSPLLGGGDPGWDPVAYAIDAAHLAGLEFHAYINTHTCWHSDEMLPPPDPNHVFYQHCNASDPDARDWLHHNSYDDPDQFAESSYVWFAPGVPAYQAYVRQQIMYVVESYDVDGVHFDRIRTPGTLQVSYDPISRQRYLDDRTNPGNRDFPSWTTDQVTRLVRDIYAQIALVKPDLRVSAAVFPDFNASATRQHQDTLAWIEQGALDTAVPMMYSTGGPGSAWDAQLSAWLAATSGLDAHVVPGHAIWYGASATLAQIALARDRGAAGNSGFSWNYVYFWDDYRDEVYQTAVATPAMPWKAAPTDAILCGYLTDADGRPVVDAQVTSDQMDYVALSGADGFFALLQAPPGTHALEVFHPDFARVTAAPPELAAGDVTRIDIELIEPAPPGDYDGDADVDLDDFWMLAFCFNGPDLVFIEGDSCRDGEPDGDGDVDLADWALVQQVYGTD